MLSLVLIPLRGISKEMLNEILMRGRIWLCRFFFVLLHVL